MNRITQLLYGVLAAVAALIAETFCKPAARLLLGHTMATGIVLPLNLYSQRTYDASLLLKAAGLVAASANGSTILDVGTGLFEADLVLDVTALEIDSNDESYMVILQGSNNATFSVSTDIIVMGMMLIGDKASTAGALYSAAADDATGRYIVPVRNERNGTTYRYLRIRTVVAGTIATGINYSAFLAKRA